jgi:hypothetical protein
MASTSKSVQWGNSEVSEFNNDRMYEPQTIPIKPNGPNETYAQKSVHEKEQKRLANLYAKFPALGEKAAENARLAGRSQEEIDQNAATAAAEQASITRRDARFMKHFGVTSDEFMRNHLEDHYEEISAHGGIDDYLDYLNTKGGPKGGRRNRSKTNKKRRTQRKKRHTRKRSTRKRSTRKRSTRKH